MECIEQPLDSSRFGGRHTVQVLRNGDLAGRMYLKTTLPALDADVCWIRRVGHALIDNIECTVGGSQVDKHWGTWYDVWYELTHTQEQERGYNKMIGDVPELTTLGTAKAAAQLYVPLQFWFNRNTGLALPLIALQYHEVRFNIQFSQLADLVCTQNGASLASVQDLNDTSILVDYIYLDQEERRRMAQVGHEYLIEQLQFNGEESITGTNQRVKLDFNHPCKEIVWVTRTAAMGATGSGKFLAHFQTSTAQLLADAASNLAKSMVAKQSVSGWSTVDLSGVASGSTNIVSATNGSTQFTFVVTNNYSSGSGHNVYVCGNVLGGSSGISTKVTEVHADVTISDSNVVTISNVISVANSLTVADVSTPVAQLGADLRQAQTDVTVNQPFNYGANLDGTGLVVRTAKLQLNGHDRFDEQPGDYFNYVQPHQHHTHTPADGVYVYSFGLNPEQHQPSGTANLSRIDTTILNLTFDGNAITGGDGSLLWIFAFSYNVFRIMSGMGGMAYAN